MTKLRMRLGCSRTRPRRRLTRASQRAWSPQQPPHLLWHLFWPSWSLALRCSAPIAEAEPRARVATALFRRSSCSYVTKSNRVVYRVRGKSRETSVLLDTSRTARVTGRRERREEGGQRSRRTKEWNSSWRSPGSGTDGGESRSRREIQGKTLWTKRNCSRKLEWSWETRRSE